MKNYLFKTLTLALFSVFLLNACSKKDKTKPGASGVGTVTADLSFSSGEDISFSYKHEKYMPSPVGLTGPDENGLYGLLMSAAQTKGGKYYMFMFTGLIEKGKGIYHPKEDGDDDDVPQAGLMLTVGDEEGDLGEIYAPYPEHDYNYTFEVTKLTDHTIKGTFSGKFTTVDSKSSVTITNGKFHFNKVTIQSKD